MPTWAATKSRIIAASDQTTPSNTMTRIVSPLFRYPPTDVKTLYKALCLAQDISAVVTGPNQKTIITLHMQLYEKAVKLQQANGIPNWFLRIGELHTCVASLRALGKYIDGSGLDAVSIEESIYSPSSVRQILGGRNYKRGVEYHITNALALYGLFFETLLEEKSAKEILPDTELLLKRLYEKCPDIHQSCNKLKQLFRDFISSYT